MNIKNIIAIIFVLFILTILNGCVEEVDTNSEDSNITFKIENLQIVCIVRNSQHLKRIPQSQKDTKVVYDISVASLTGRLMISA